MTGSSRKNNPWNQHLSQVRKNNPGLSFADAVKEAKKTYKRGDASVVRKKSYTSVDLSRHTGDDGLEKSGAQTFEEKTESNEKKGVPVASSDQEAGISFEDNDVGVENPTIKPGPENIEVIPPAHEDQRDQYREPKSAGMSGALLQPFFDLVTKTTGHILSLKYRDPEFRKIWTLEKEQLENISESTAMLINRYMPGMEDYPELVAFGLSATVVFGPIAYSTLARITENEEEKQRQEEAQEETPKEASVQEVKKSWNNKKLPGR